MQSREDSEFSESYNKFMSANKNSLRLVGLWPQVSQFVDKSNFVCSKQRIIDASVFYVARTRAGRTHIGDMG